MRKRNLTLMMNKILICALKTMREKAKAQFGFANYLTQISCFAFYV